MRRHRVAGPDRADFARRLIADREHEIHLRRVRLGELIPALRAQALRRQLHGLQQFERERMHFAFGKAALPCDRPRNFPSCNIVIEQGSPRGLSAPNCRCRGRGRCSSCPSLTPPPAGSTICWFLSVARACSLTARNRIFRLRVRRRPDRRHRRSLRHASGTSPTGSRSDRRSIACPSARSSRWSRSLR